MECKTKIEEEGYLVHEVGCSEPPVRHYLECRVTQYIDHQYRRISTNEIIPSAWVQLWKPARASNSDWQGVLPENEVLLRDYQTCNIRSMKSGSLYELHTGAEAVVAS